MSEKLIEKEQILGMLTDIQAQLLELEKTLSFEEHAEVYKFVTAQQTRLNMCEERVVLLEDKYKLKKRPIGAARIHSSTIDLILQAP